MYTFAGRTALVTGGARGVGRAVATRLASAGAHVVVNCFHSYPAAKALQAQLADEGLRVDVVRGSVARREQVERIFAEVTSLVGGLDLLVSNAAAGRFGPVCAVADEAVERAISTNLHGVVVVRRGCARADAGVGRCHRQRVLGRSGARRRELRGRRHL